MDRVVCPVCRKSKLVLRQINLNCAVYLCRDKLCNYPMGHNWLYVPRTLDEMYRDKKKRVKKKPTIKNEKPAMDEGFNINNLIEDEINKLQNSNECASALDITSDFFDTENFASFFESNESEVNTNSEFIGGTTNCSNNVECFNYSNLVKDSYIENVLHNESTTSNTEVYKDALGFCDNFNSSQLSDLLSNDSVLVESCGNEISNCDEGKSVNYEIKDSKIIEYDPELTDGTNAVADGVEKLINRSRNVPIDKGESKGGRTLILNQYIFNKQT